MSTGTTSAANAVNLARQLAYRFLALATSDPRSRQFSELQRGALVHAAQSAADYLRAAPQCRPDSRAPGELTPECLTFSSLIQILRDPQLDLNAQYERVFGLMVSKKCPPYETEYCPQTFSVYRSQALADIAGFYRAFALEPSRDMPERQDHISLELNFMAWLIAKELRAAAAEQASVCREAQQRFVRDHLAWWVPAFARALRDQSERYRDGEDDRSNFYSLLAQNLAAFIAVERAVLSVAPPKELVAAGPVDPPEEMSCATCAGSDETSDWRMS